MGHRHQQIAQHNRLLRCVGNKAIDELQLDAEFGVILFNEGHRAIHRPLFEIAMIGFREPNNAHIVMSLVATNVAVNG